MRTTRWRRHTRAIAQTAGVTMKGLPGFGRVKSWRYGSLRFLGMAGQVNKSGARRALVAEATRARRSSFTRPDPGYPGPVRNLVSASRDS